MNSVSIEVAGNGSIAGITTLAHSVDHSNIEISLLDDVGNVLANTTTDASGNFSLGDVAPGIYSMEADVDGYMAAQSLQFAVGGNDNVVVVNAILLAGDVNDDNVIDLLDITQFAADYTGTAVPTVDFDRNATLDLRDFSFMVNNLDLVGPSEWN